MFLSVLSVDKWNRFRTEGYGYVSLPSTPGLHKISVSTWRPLSSSPIGEMRRFFIGGSPELEDPSFVGIPTNFEVFFYYLNLYDYLHLNFISLTELTYN